MSDLVGNPEDRFSQNEAHFGTSSWPEVIKLFSCSTQLNMKYKLLINIEIASIDRNFMFKSPKPGIYPTIVGILTFLSKVNFLLS